MLSIAVARISLGDTQNFLVRSFFISHFEHSNGVSFDKATGNGRVTDHDKDVQRVTVEVVSLGNVAVVERIEQGRVKHSVELDDAGFLVYFVLVGATSRNLNDRVEDVGSIWANFREVDRHSLYCDKSGSGERVT